MTGSTVLALISLAFALSVVVRMFYISPAHSLTRRRLTEFERRLDEFESALSALANSHKMMKVRRAIREERTSPDETPEEFRRRINAEIAAGKFGPAARR